MFTNRRGNDLPRIVLAWARLGAGFVGVPPSMA